MVEDSGPWALEAIARWLQRLGMELFDALSRWRNLGATPDERAATLPGDDLIAEPADNVTRAVGIHAPAHTVWRWLVQIGQDRGGMYSSDRLENLFGLDIHSADRIHEEWQDLQAGDRVTIVPSGHLGMPDGYSFPVQRVETDRCLVLRQQPPEHPWNAVWSFVIEPVGSGSCRLISRSRSQRRPGLRGSMMRFAAIVMEPITLLMTRKMLHGIKERAETEHLLADVSNLV